MADLRLYRKIYCIVKNSVSGETYTLIDPVGISTTSSGSTGVVENITPTQENTGIYFVDLNPNLYTFDDIYSLFWDVQYVIGAPVRRLETRFRLNPVNISGGSIEIEVVDNSVFI